MSEAKRQYMVRDLHDWCEYCGAEFKWPDAFPIRSVLPLRLTLAANSQPALIKAICKSVIISTQEICFDIVMMIFQLQQPGGITRTLERERYVLARLSYMEIIFNQIFFKSTALCIFLGVFRFYLKLLVV